MNCLSCGKAINQNLNYCNYCGASVSEMKNGAENLPETSLNIVLAGIMAIPIAGLGIIIGLMSVMKGLNFNNFWILVFAFLCFLLFLAAETVFIRLLKKGFAFNN